MVRYRKYTHLPHIDECSELFDYMKLRNQKRSQYQQEQHLFNSPIGNLILVIFLFFLFWFIENSVGEF